MQKGRWIIASAVGIVLILGACSKSSTPTTTSPAANAPTSMAATTGVSYTAHDFSFDGPDTLPAGTKDITFTNAGAQDHEMLFIRLDQHQDWTAEQIAAYVKKDPKAQPKWAIPVGGVVPPIKPGASGKMMFFDFSGQQPVPIPDGSLEPGTYMVMCFVTDPATVSKAGPEQGRARYEFIDSVVTR
jgi:hypothetical protein